MTPTEREVRSLRGGRTVRSAAEKRLWERVKSWDYEDEKADMRGVLDGAARLRAEVKDLRGKMERTCLERDALRDFVRGMADGYARAGQTQKEWTMRDVLADAAALAPKRRAKR